MLWFLASEIDNFTGKCLIILFQDMKYYYSVSAKKTQMLYVLLKDIHYLRTILNDELSAQVIQEAINMFAYLQ